MLKCENLEVYGFKPAIRGMRNPMNSWNKSDSYCTHVEDPETLETAKYQFFMGDDDLELAKKLVKAGTEHRKFLRMIQVYMDITAPLYWWKEFDTYKVGTVVNSCSTMHTITDKEFTLDDFSCEHLAGTYTKVIVNTLNAARKGFLETNDKSFWYQLIQLLPTSYNQRRTVMINYEVAMRIIEQRLGHKLDEWHQLITVLLELPYLEEMNA